MNDKRMIARRLLRPLAIGAALVAASTPASAGELRLAQANTGNVYDMPPPLPPASGGLPQGGAPAMPPPLPQAAPQYGVGFPQAQNPATPFPQNGGQPVYGGQAGPAGQPPLFAPPPLPQPASPPTEQVKLPPGVDAGRLAAVAAQERQDFGVQPTSQLHAGPMHGETPLAIPGGRVIDTPNLVAMLGHQPPVPVLLLDILGSGTRLPGSQTAAWASQPGSFGDDIDASLATAMRGATGGDPTRVVVVYCSDPHCWMSYNAALRIINLGYRNVFWYRGGIQAWQQAGLPLQQMGQRQ